jgi:hypothetical protein
MCLYSLYLPLGLFRLMHCSSDYFVKKKTDHAHVATCKKKKNLELAGGKVAMWARLLRVVF